jgi:alpha-L-rhamnosidase
MLVILFNLFFINVFAVFRPVNLTCEYKENPLGIEAVSPRFGWWIDAVEPGIQQSAYQIQIADAKQKLAQGDANMWDSGRTKSNNNFSVSYKGLLLLSSKKYHWRIRVWNQDNKVSEWSDVAEFRTGILSQNEWEKAQWIAFESLNDSMKIVPGIHGKGDGLSTKLLKRAINPVFRKSFTLNRAIADASVSVSGLGQYELYLNGKKVSDDFLTPGWTNYEKRCLYNTYDVTKYLQKGENILGSLVGTGFFYINRERYRKYVGAYGYPMLRILLRISYMDGTTEEIVTDKGWKTAASALNYSSIYGGEDYDARLEQDGWNNKGFDDAKWKNAVLTAGPGGKMTAQVEYPLSLMDTIIAKNILSPSPGKHIYDFGQNASGIISLKVKGKAGDTIRITPSELLNDQGQVSQKSSGGPFYFEYVLKGIGVEEWTPKFTYYGFRYAMVEGSGILSMNMLHTRNSAPSAGSFECSNPLFNQIYHNIDWALRSNMASVLTDCPHREKMGWLEQAHLMGESLKYNYDVFHLYNKVVDDIIDAQQPDGMVPSIAPEYVQFTGAFRDDPGYGSAAIVLPWYLYKWYGDKQVLLKSYRMMNRYASYLSSKAELNILSHGLGDWLDLGSNEPGVSQLTPVSLTATAFYYQNIRLLGEMAKILGESNDARKYENLAIQIKKSFNAKFFDPVHKVYGTGSQTSFSMPLYMGLLENESDRDEVFKNLTDSILAHQKKITAGDIGHRFLVQTLQGADASQLLFDMNNNTETPGYGYQIKHGATALAEHWSGPTLDWLSQNHMIFGHLMEWFYSGLGGISQQEGDLGFQRIKIKPQITGDITWAKTSYKSINGKIEVDWKRTGENFILSAVIPANSAADIVFPLADVNKVRVNGILPRKHKGIKSIRVEDKKLVMSVLAGSYHFVCESNL